MPKPRGNSRYARVMRLFETPRNQPGVVELANPSVFGLSESGAPFPYDGIAQVNGHYAGGVAVYAAAAAQSLIVPVVVPPEVPDPVIGDFTYLIKLYLEAADVAAVEAALPVGVSLYAGSADAGFGQIVGQDFSVGQAGGSYALPPFDWRVVFLWERSTYAGKAE